MNRINKALIGGSLILLISFNLFNLANFAFQFAMARFLSLAEYGSLAAILSLLYVTGIFAEPIQTVITKYASQEKDAGKLKNILRRSLKKALSISFILVLIFLGLAIPLSSILNVKYSLIALASLMIFTSFLTPITRGMLQGRKMFGALGRNIIIEGSVKLLLSAALAFAGWGVFGAVAGMIMGAVTALIFSFIDLRKIINSKEEGVPTPGIYSYTKPVFLTMLVVILFYSLDVLIVKVMFAEEIAGSYAILSTLSKIIFWGTQPISRAMFPISSENTTQKKKDHSVAFTSFGMLFVCIFLFLIVVILFPEQLVSIFSGKSLSIPYIVLIYLSLGMSIFSLTNLNLLYKISRDKTKGSVWLISFIALELVLFALSRTITQFSLSFLLSSIAFFIGSFFILGDNK